jgi:hypothetical protein
MTIEIYGLRAILALSFVALGLGWWKLFTTRSEAKSKFRLAAICVTISNAWLLLALFLPRRLPSDDSRLWPLTIGGNAVAMGLAAAIAIFGRGPGKAWILSASVLSALTWIVIYIADSLIIV